MNSLTMWVMLLLLLIFALAYQLRIATTRIRCWHIGRTKNIEKKWAKHTQGRIDFQNGWYYVLPKRIFRETEMFLFLFPIKVDCLLFRGDSSMPLNPENWGNDWEGPEQRKALDKKEDVEALAQGNRQTFAKQVKQGRLAELMPIITLIGFALLGFGIYLMYQRQDSLGKAMNVLQQMVSR